MSSIESGRACPVPPSISHLNPSINPNTSDPPRILRIVAALITLLIPGAGPPPTRMPTVARCSINGFSLDDCPSVFHRREDLRHGCILHFSERQAVRTTRLRPFVQSNVGSKAVIPRAGLKSLSAWIVLFHVVDQSADFAAQRRSFQRMNSSTLRTHSSSLCAQ